MVLTGRHLYVNGFPKLPRSEQVPTQGFDIVIGENCWIASGAILIGPLRIGSNSIIGAGAVVTKDVEPFSFVGCSPAKFIKKLKEEA
jgi:acetyltransferase-like isoleucine patch superfamily enzyme